MKWAHLLLAPFQFARGFVRGWNSNRERRETVREVLAVEMLVRDEQRRLPGEPVDRSVPK